MKIDQPYLLIDFDDEKIIFFVIKFDKELNSEIICSDIVNSKGIIKGRITDIDAASEIIKKNLNLIEDKINFIFKDVTILINPDNIKCINISGYKKLSGAKVLKEDVTYILNEIKELVSENEPKYSLIHLFNSNFSIDKNNLRNIPLGLYGDFYNQDMSFFSVEKNNLKNFKLTLNNSNVNVDRVILKPFVEGINMLSKANLDSNTAIVKIGKNRSNVSLFKNQAFIYSENFNFGTNLIIKDLAKLCSISFDIATNILTNLSFVEIKQDNYSEHLDAKYFLNIPFRKITFKLILDIFISRLEEIFELSYDKNINLVNLKNTSNVNIIIEDLSMYDNICHIINNNFSNKYKIFYRKLDENYAFSGCFGAAELISKGWSKEAIPLIQSKKSVISRILSNIFK